MYKIFWAQCKSNWKKNLRNGISGYAVVMLWLIMGIANTGNVWNVAGLIGLVVVVISVMMILDVTVPKTLYICPYGFEDRKKYVKKAVAMNLCISMAVMLVAALVISYGTPFNWYMILTKGSLMLIILCMENMQWVLPDTRSGMEQDRWSHMAQFIGWRSTSLVIFYEGFIVLFLVGMKQYTPIWCFGNVIQWAAIVAGPFIIRRFYKKHFELFVSMAADYETYEKYQAPAKK